MQNVKHTAAEQAALAAFIGWKDSTTEAQLREVVRTGELPLPSVVISRRPIGRG